MKKTLLLSILAALLLGCTNQTKQTNDVENMDKDFLTLATERYSVRHFSDKPVEQEKIDKILRAAQVAPTAVNSQPQMIYLLRSAEAMEKANEVSPCMYGAPQAFLVCYDTERACQRGDNGNYGDIDCSIIITHMMLEAADLGLGTCAVGMFDVQKTIEAFNLPANIRPVLMLPFGYPAADAQPSDRHSEYRPLEETVKEL